MRHIINLTLGAIVYSATRGRIVTRTVEDLIRRRNAEWREKSDSIQADLDEEHRRGWAFRYCDGRRIDFVPFGS